MVKSKKGVREMLVSFLCGFRRFLWVCERGARAMGDEGKNRVAVPVYRLGLLSAKQDCALVLAEIFLLMGMGTGFH